MRNLKLTIEYDGTNYVGWQIQKNGTAVQGLIQAALRKITNERGNLLGASRTDSGVHALHQVACYQTAACFISCTALTKGVNALLPHDIRIKKIVEVKCSFHPIRNAKKKTYTYFVLNENVHSALLLKRVWHVRKPLNISAIKKGMKYLVGEHDFRAFMAQGSSVKGTERKIFKATLRIVKNERKLLLFTFQGNGFLRNQIRNMMGTLVEIGEGRRESKSIREILKSKDRKKAGVCAPACGLYLVKIDYSSSSRTSSSVS